MNRPTPTPSIDTATTDTGIPKATFTTTAGMRATITNPITNTPTPRITTATCKPR